jgi:hypothetical protein
MAVSHGQDFYAWSRQQALLLRQGRFGELDVGYLAEEVEDMGGSVRRELGSRLEVLLMHLLKWRFQPSYQGKSWMLTIAEQRRRIEKLVRKNPSLRPELEESVLDAYEDARHTAAIETGLDISIFPEACPWTCGQVLDSEFWPADG